MNALNSDFYSLYGRVLDLDSDVDFTQLRISYTHTDEYIPYDIDTNNEHNEQEMYRHYYARNRKTSLHFARLVLRRHRLHLDAHYFLAGEHQYHKIMVQGLLTSILSSGNGLSYKTAFVVIDQNEEQALFRLMGYKSISQKLVEVDGHMYDVFNLRSIDNNEEEWYFNIDYPQAWANKYVE